MGGCLRGVVFLFLLAPLAAGDPVAGPHDVRHLVEPPTVASDLRSLGEFVEVFCLDCHGGRRAVGGVVLDEVAANPSDPGIEAELLLQIRDRLRARDMPPIDVDASPEEAAMSRPGGAEYQQAVAVIGDVFADRLATAGVPAVVIRRLSRRELARTIEDVFGEVEGIDSVIRGLPADDVGHGFDHLGEVLSASPLLIEKIMDLAELVARRVITDPANDAAEVRDIPLAETRGGSIRREGSWVNRNGEVAADVSMARPGRYRVEFDLAGRQAGEDPVRFALRIDRRTIRVVEVPETPERPATHALEFESGDEQVRLGAAFLNDYFDPDHPDPSRRDRNAVLLALRVIGPLDAAEPGAFQRSMNAIMSRGETRRSMARAARRLLERCWGRPIPTDEAYRIADAVMAAAAAAEATARTSLVARQRALVVYGIASPEFLYRIERDQPDATPAPDGTVPLDGYAIARRLGGFLRGGPPDERLLDAARRGRLDDDEGIRREVRRLLAGDAPRALGAYFAVQWLHIDGVEGLEPDPGRFGDVDPMTLADMREETVRAFEEIVREDRPLTDLFSSDASWLSARLAGHYRLENLDLPPEGFVRVDLSAAGVPHADLGVLRHASVLMSTSNPTRTSPVKRGKWVLQSLLDCPPPPPPPGVDQLPSRPRDGEASNSLRAMLEAHRADPECASCHVRMDALGFAMESLDAAGRWRETSDGVPIDTAARLPDGTRIDGPLDLRDVLIRDPALLRSFAKHLFIYALGRGPEWRDEPLLDQLAIALQERPMVSTAVEMIALSDAFRRRPAQSTID